MNQVFIVLALGAFVASCGKSACDCVEEDARLSKEMEENNTNHDKWDELWGEREALREECEHYSSTERSECD